MFLQARGINPIQWEITAVESTTGSKDTKIRDILARSFWQSNIYIEHHGLGPTLAKLMPLRI